MKKILLSAACLAALMAPATMMTATTTVSVATTIVNEDEKVQIKPEELPDAVKTTLADEKYKGWNITTVYKVKSATTYYEVELTKEKETKIFKFDNEGKILE